MLPVTVQQLMAFIYSISDVGCVINVLMLAFRERAATKFRMAEVQGHGSAGSRRRRK